MSLNESILEDAALIMPGATLIPAFCLRLSPLRSGSHGEKERRKAIPEEERDGIFKPLIYLSN